MFTALTVAQEEHNGEAVYLDEIADGAGVSEEEARALLHDLTTVQNLVTELQGSDTPTWGPVRGQAQLLTGVAPHAMNPPPRKRSISGNLVDRDRFPGAGVARQWPRRRAFPCAASPQDGPESRGSA